MKLIAAFVLLALPLKLVADEYLNISFSRKNQIKTGLVWIQHKPKLILSGNQSNRGAGVIDRQTGSPIPVPRIDPGDQSPYNQVGKLFFTLGDEPGRVSSCSAAFAGGTHTVMTAAHCVMTTSGHWNDDFIFIRSYGTRHQEIFAVQCIAVLEKWGALLGDDMLSHDYAFLRTNRLSRHGYLETGDQSPPEMLNIVGYSDNFRDGRQMFELPVEISINDLSFSSSLTGIGSGSSGAPWIDSSGKRFFSVTSHYKKEDIGVMNGPWLSSRARDLRGFVENRCRH